MNQPELETGFAKDRWSSISGIHRFGHQAMNAIFEIIIQHENARYAKQAAEQAFDELDKLEGQLSRFIENSDISQINNLPVGRPLRIGLAAFECLQLAGRIHTETNGAFDVTIGSLLRCWLNKDKTLRSPSKEELKIARQRTGMHLVKLDPQNYTVEVLASPMHIDLGGIGKGYAVDKMAELLRDWDFDRVLIHGGFSSVLAVDAPAGMRGWPITLSNPLNRKQKLQLLYLQNSAVSASGLEKGQHIIDPRTAQPVQNKLAAWSCAADAATADALSTAFMIMSPDEINRYCIEHPGTLALVITKQSQQIKQEEKILYYGPWSDSRAF